MTHLGNFLPVEVLSHITSIEQGWLRGAFQRYGGRYPVLEEIWFLMDEAWDTHNCDPESMDARIGAFYDDPVWLLNGLFIERHEQSMENRRRFTDWVVKQRPQRLADYGGGFGSLARMIGAALPNAVIEVIEPHAHPAAIALAASSDNVRYRPKLSGEYDLLIATDVFEHVPDPLALMADTAAHLREGGQYLTANCFLPVIRCHLPQTFHFRYSWMTALKAMGMVAGDVVCYGQAFKRSGGFDLDAARAVERRSRRLFPWLERMPGRVRGRVAHIAFPGSS